MKRYFALVLLLVALLGAVPTQLSAAMLRRADGSHDQVGFGETIDIDEGHPVHDVVCFFCTVHVHGDLNGDLVSFFGNVDVSEGRTIAGDVVMFGGNFSLANEARLEKDLVVFGADLNQASTSSVRGDRVVFAGGAWLLAILLPLLIPIGIIWLVVRVVFRRPYRFPAYPGGRRF